MAGPAAPRLALTDRNGRLRVLSVHEAGQATDVAPPLEPGAIESGPLPRLTWPTWLNGGRLLVSATTPSGRPALWTLTPGKPGVNLVYRPPAGTPNAIAPGVPHYANPSPDGRRLALATPFDSGLMMLLADVDESGDPPELVRGAPLFSTWSPSGDGLLMHAGTTLHRMEHDSPQTVTTIGLNCVDVRVPAWSPDGKTIASIRHGELRNAVVLWNRDGRHLARVGAVEGAAALAWSPRGDLLAVSGARRGGGSFTGIELVDVRSGEMRPLVKDPVLLWLWSPDGNRIAYIRRAGGEGRLAWRIVNLDGTVELTSAPFYPGALFAVVVAFFDQYLQSHKLWSPDGRYLLATGRIAVNGPPAETVGAQVLLLDTHGRSPLTPLCDGEIASWQYEGGGRSA